MALINLYAISRLFKIVKRTLGDHLKQRKQGKATVFYRDVLKNQDGIECWERKQEKNQKEA